MPIAPCRECGKEVSDTAQACPHCGVRFPTMRAANQWAQIGCAAILVAGLIVYAITTY